MLTRILIRINFNRAALLYVIGFLNLMLIAGLIMLLAQQVGAASNTYYVAKSGSDSNPGTEGQPWLTIRKAAATIKAGETVIVRAGTYNEQVIPANSGSAGNYITYQVYPGDVVIIDGTGIDLGANLTQCWANGLVKIWNKSYLKFDGFEIYNADTDGSDGVTVYAQAGKTCSYITLQNLKIHKTGRSGIDFMGLIGTLNNVKVYNCDVYDTNWAADQEAISLSDVTTGEVSYCRVHDIKEVAGYRQQGIDAKDGSSGILIHHNEVYGTSIGIYIDGASADIYNNYIHNNSTTTEGILLGNEIEPVTNVSANIYNNVIYGVGTSFKVFQPNLHNDGTDTYTFKFINNTIYNNIGKDYAPIAMYGATANYESCIIRNNIISCNIVWLTNLLYCQNTPTGITIDHNSYYNSGGIHGATYLGTSYLTTNPSMTNPEDGNFTLGSSSPCINTGSITYAPATDYAGNSRPQGAGIDVGAYEHIAPEYRKIFPFLFLGKN